MFLVAGRNGQLSYSVPKDLFAKFIASNHLQKQSPRGVL